MSKRLNLRSVFSIRSTYLDSIVRIYNKDLFRLETYSQNRCTNKKVLDQKDKAMPVDRKRAEAEFWIELLIVILAGLFDYGYVEGSGELFTSVSQFTNFELERGDC